MENILETNCTCMCTFIHSFHVSSQLFSDFKLASIWIFTQWYSTKYLKELLSILTYTGSLRIKMQFYSNCLVIFWRMTWNSMTVCRVLSHPQHTQLYADDLTWLVCSPDCDQRPQFSSQDKHNPTPPPPCYQPFHSPSDDQPIIWHSSRHTHLPLPHLPDQSPPDHAYCLSPTTRVSEWSETHNM